MASIQAPRFLSDPPDEILGQPAILVAGDEPYLIDKVIEAVLERVLTAPGADQFDLEKRDAAELEPAELDSIVSTMPLVNDRRIVVLKNVPSVSAATRDHLKEILVSRPDGLCLIGTGSAKMRGNLYDVWESNGARITCELPRKSSRSKEIDFDFARWLAGRAKADFGQRLDPAAARLLAESPGELGPLYNELEKAALHAGEGNPIEVADVEAVCAGGAMTTVWEWCDAVGARDGRRAIELLEILLDGGESAYRLVPLLATHFCRLGVVVNLPKGDVSSIVSALPGRAWPAMARKLADQARNHTPASVARALDALAAADRMLKSTRHGEEFVLHRHVLEIVHEAA